VHRRVNVSSVFIYASLDIETAQQRPISRREENGRLLRYPVDIIRGVVEKSGGTGSYIPYCGHAVWHHALVNTVREKKRKEREKNFKTSRRVGRTGVISTLDNLERLLARLHHVCTRIYTCMRCAFRVTRKRGVLNYRALLTAAVGGRWEFDVSILSVKTI